MGRKRGRQDRSESMVQKTAIFDLGRFLSFASPVNADIKTINCLLMDESSFMQRRYCSVVDRRET